jgi:hypothetical protein
MEKKHMLALQAGAVSGVALAIADFIFLWLLEALIDYAKLGFVLYWAILLVAAVLSALLLVPRFRRLTGALASGLAVGIVAGTVERIALALLVAARLLIWPGEKGLSGFVSGLFPDFIYSIVSTAIVLGVIFAAAFLGYALYRRIKG